MKLNVMNVQSLILASLLEKEGKEVTTNGEVSVLRRCLGWFLLFALHSLP